jgi:hypothetical protein
MYGNLLINTAIQQADYGFKSWTFAKFVMQEKDWTLNLGATIYYEVWIQEQHNSQLYLSKINVSYTKWWATFDMFQVKPVQNFIKIL